MGILDDLFGAMGYVPQPQPPQQPQQPSAPAPQEPGFGDRAMSGVQGFLNSPSLMSGIGHLIGGFSSGKRTDPAGVQQAAIGGQLQQLMATGAITPTQARFLAANPKSWEELSKAMINVPMTVAPDGSIIQSRPFGQIGVPGGVPISDRADVTNPDGSKSPGFAVKPSLVNPRGGLVQPGAAPQAPMPQTAIPAAPQPAPMGAGYGGSPASNPNLRPMGQPMPQQMPQRQAGGAYITEQSPELRKEQEGRGQALVEDFAGIQKSARGAVQTKNVLQVMSALKTFSGAAAPFQQYMASLASSFGLSTEKLRGKTTAGDLFSALSNEMVLAASGGSLGAQISNADRDFIATRFPTLAQTEGGRRELMTYLNILADRQLAVGQLAEQYTSANGPGRGSMRGFNEYLRQWSEQPNNRMFSSFADRFGGEPAGPGSPGVTQTTVPRMRSIAEAMKLPPGTRFIDPDGKERTR